MNRKRKNSRTEFVKDWVSKHPFLRLIDMQLDHIDHSLVRISAPVYLKECTKEGVVTGGIHSLIGNAAAVAMAMLHSPQYFTPLYEQIMKYPRPIVLRKDEKIIADARLIKIEGNRIFIKVEIKSDSDDKIKAQGIFKYAILSREYEPEKVKPRT